MTPQFLCIISSRFSLCYNMNNFYWSIFKLTESLHGYVNCTDEPRKIILI